jgi:hypothetical protein
MCDCEDDQTCDAPLVCMSGTCLFVETAETGETGGTGNTETGNTETGNTETGDTETGEDCPAGSLDCPCYGNMTCDGELVCESGVCSMSLTGSLD